MLAASEKPEMAPFAGTSSVWSFEGKVVLVTGAISGIGETAAVAFATAGAQVFGIARRREALESARTRHP